MGNPELSGILLQTSVTTLPCIREDNKLNQWFFETAKRYVTSPVLEIGSGEGNISGLFVRHGIHLYLSDPEDGHRQALKEKFHEEPNVISVLKLDLWHPEFETRYAKMLGQFSSVFALNITDHQCLDKRTIANAKLLLKKRGRMILLLPANTALFNGLGQGLQQWIGTNQEVIRKLLSKDFEILKTFFFNIVGISGWWLSGPELNKKESAAEQISEYEELVPIFRIADPSIFKQFGLSVMVVVRKL